MWRGPAGQERIGGGIVDEALLPRIPLQPLAHLHRNVGQKADGHGAVTDFSILERLPSRFHRVDEILLVAFEREMNFVLADFGIENRRGLGLQGLAVIRHDPAVRSLETHVGSFRLVVQAHAVRIPVFGFEAGQHVPEAIGRRVGPPRFHFHRPRAVGVLPHCATSLR